MPRTLKKHRLMTIERTFSISLVRAPACRHSSLNRPGPTPLSCRAWSNYPKKYGIIIDLALIKRYY